MPILSCVGFHTARNQGRLATTISLVSGSIRSGSDSGVAVDSLSELFCICVSGCLYFFRDFVVADKLIRDSLRVALNSKICESN